MNTRGNIRAILLLTDSEFRLLLRQKMVYVGLAVSALLVGLCCLGVHLQLNGHHAKEMVEGRLISEFINATYILLPLMVGVVAAGSMGGDIQSGLLRGPILRGVPRWGVLIAKLVSLGIYAYMMLLALLLMGYLAGALLFGVKGSVVVIGMMYFGGDAGFFVLDGATAFFRTVIAYFLVGCSLSSLAALAVMLASLSGRMAPAALVALGVYYTSFILGVMPFMESVRNLLPTKYMTLWKYAMAPEIIWSDIAYNGGMLAAYTIAYIGVAIVAFESRDL